MGLDEMSCTLWVRLPESRQILGDWYQTRASPLRNVSGLVGCKAVNDMSRDAGPYLHVYVHVTVILPTKTRVEVLLCFVRHL